MKVAGVVKPQLTPQAASLLVRLAAFVLAAAASTTAYAGMHGSIRAVEFIGLAAFALALVPGVELASLVGVLCLVTGVVARGGSAIAAGAVGLLVLSWALACDLAENLTLQPSGRRVGPRLRRWAVQAAAVLGAGLAGAVLSVLAASLDLTVGRNVGIVLAVMAPVLAFGALALAWQYRAVPPADEPATAEPAG